MLKKQTELWNSWHNASTNRRIFAAMVIVAVMTAAAKFATVSRDLVVAGYFGTGEVVDAFLIAFLLPMFAINVLTGSFSAAMMPTYIRVRDNKGIVAAHQLFSSVMTLGVLFLIVAAAVMAAFAPVLLPLLGSGFSTDNITLTQTLFYWLLPVLVVTGIGHLYATIMNAGERFAVAALAPAITPLGAVTTLLFLAQSWGVYALVIGILLGSILELIILMWAVARRGIPLLPYWQGMTDEVRVVMGQYTPMVAGAFLMSGTVLADQAMAAMLESGSVATLNYANKVVAMLLGIGAMALGTAVLPHFSRMVATEDWQGIRHTFRKYSKLILLISAPVTAILFMLSETIIGLLFERGAFSAEDTFLVGQVQAFYVLQIPFYILGILTVRLISSLRANHILMWGACISLPLNILLNFIFMQWLGVAGIALSTFFVYVVSFIYLSYFLNKNLHQYENK